MKRISWEKWKRKNFAISLRQILRKSAAMYDEFAVAESYEKGGPQVATEKTFLSARATEIAERRNTEHDGIARRTAIGRSREERLSVASGFRVAPLRFQLATVTCVVRGSRCAWFPSLPSSLPVVRRSLSGESEMKISFSARSALTSRRTSGSSPKFDRHEMAGF